MEIYELHEYIEVGNREWGVFWWRCEQHPRIRTIWDTEDELMQDITWHLISEHPV